MVQNQKSENQRKVIHVDLEKGVLGVLIDAQKDFEDQKPENNFLVSMQHSATYLFETVDDSLYFSQLLDLRDIPHSYHPAKDHNRVATRDMDFFGKAILSSA